VAVTFRPALGALAVSAVGTAWAWRLLARGFPAAARPSVLLHVTGQIDLIELIHQAVMLTAPSVTFLRRRAQTAPHNSMCRISSATTTPMQGASVATERMRQSRKVRGLVSRA
jgi:hypothetical protein